MHILLVIVNLGLRVDDLSRDVVRHSCRHEPFEVRKRHLPRVQAEDGDRDALTLGVLVRVGVQLADEPDALLLPLLFVLKSHASFHCVDTWPKELLRRQKFHYLIINIT